MKFWRLGLLHFFGYRCMSVMYERMSGIANFDEYICFIYGDHSKRYATFVVILYLITFFRILFL